MTSATIFFLCVLCGFLMGMSLMWLIVHSKLNVLQKHLSLLLERFKDSVPAKLHHAAIHHAHTVGKTRGASRVSLAITKTNRTGQYPSPEQMQTILEEIRNSLGQELETAVEKLNEARDAELPPTSAN